MSFVALAGCARDPLRDVPRLADVTREDQESIDPAIAAALQANLAEQPSERVGLGGFFSSIFGGSAEAAPEASSEAAASNAERAPTQAALATTAPAPEPRGGFFSRLFGSGATNASAPAQSPGLLPRACDLSRSQRGRRVEARAGFTLYDSFPNSTAPRPFYVTGFRDGCARVITASLVMFGDSGAYQIRELYSGRNRQPDRFDQSYQRLRSRICRVGARESCGARLSRFEASVAMLTAYDRFETSPTHTNILLHDRSVVALSR